MKECYAKSNPKITIKKHSEDVYDEALKIYRNTTANEIDSDKSILKYASLLHDIGKYDKNFQTYIKKNKAKKKYTPHQFISWAFINAVCEIENKDIISNIVFWHHGVKKIPDINAEKILDLVNSTDIESMVSYCRDLDIKIYDDYKSRITDMYTEIPDYYVLEKNIMDTPKNNAKLIYLRMCVIIADRKVSGAIIDNSIISNCLNLTKSPFGDSSRFDKQKEIVSQTKKTSVIKAPTGYGKTMMGLLWYGDKKKKTLWVCPRNAVAVSTYDSIIAELLNAKKDLNVQLCYENEVKKCNFDTSKYSPDIIVTNIDYYLRPYVDGGKDMVTLMFMLTANVIFDEYHELVSSSPLFSLFASLMVLRNNLVKSNTLLLSGTPIELNYLWDTLLNQTKVLPDSKSHLKAIHTEKYAINVLNEPPEKLGLNSLYFTNTIKNCQNIGELYKNSILVHSDFTKEHREERMSNLMSSYGKNPISNVKLPYISTLILQAALDISFSKVYDVPLSPESTLQRLGRCNRWGEINNAELNIVINDENNTGNALITELLYSKELNGKWLEVLRGLDKCKLTLDEIYKLYNDFNNNNANEIKRFVKNELNASSKAISNNIYPIKRKIISGNNGRKVFKGGGNPLRSSGNEVFYIVKDNKGCWVGPFNKKIEKRWDKEFKEKGSIVTDIKNEYKELAKNPDDRFDYGKISEASYIKNISIDSIRHNAQLNISPYLALYFNYNERLGVVK